MYTLAQNPAPSAPKKKRSQKLNWGTIDPKNLFRQLESKKYSNHQGFPDGFTNKKGKSVTADDCKEYQAIFAQRQTELEEFVAEQRKNLQGVLAADFDEPGGRTDKRSC